MSEDIPECINGVVTGSQIESNCECHCDIGFSGELCDEIILCTEEDLECLNDGIVNG